MSRSRESSKPTQTRRAPARSIEARENQMISYAMDLAEKHLLEGTATSQEITHFLKLGTSLAQLEREKLAHENELLKAKTAALASQQRTEEMYKNAIAAMQVYSGLGESEEYEA